MNTSGRFPASLSDPHPAFPPPPGPALGNPPLGRPSPPGNPSPPPIVQSEIPFLKMGVLVVFFLVEGSADQWIAVSSVSIFLPEEGSITPNVCTAAIAAGTVTLLLMSVKGFTPLCLTWAAFEGDGLTYLRSGFHQRYEPTRWDERIGVSWNEPCSN